MKKLLVPTDFSKRAEAAAEVAIEIAAKTNAEIYFLHIHAPELEMVHKVAHGASHHSAHAPDSAGPARAKLDEWIKLAAHRGVAAKETLVMEEESAGQIEKYIDAFSIDLVVMGSDSGKELKNILIGSKTQELVRHAHVPVLIVKNKPVKFNPKKIVFASTFEYESNQLIEFINHWASLWGSTVHLLLVCTPEMKAVSKHLEDMKHYSPRIIASSQLVSINAADVEKGILEYALREKPDLVIMETHGKSSLIQLISHSIAERVTAQLECPVMIRKIEGR